MGIAARLEPMRQSRAWRIARYLFFPQWLFNRKVEVTRRGYIFLGLILLVAGAAFNTGNNMLHLVLALMLAAMIASFSISEYMIRDLKVTRSAPETVAAGAPFRVTYTLRNEKSVIPSFAVTVSEKLDDREVTALLAYLSAGEEAVIRGGVTAERRGRRRFTDAMMSTRAPFGWFLKAKKIPLTGEIVVLPRTEPFEIDRELIATRGEERPMPRRGRGEELFGFRSYVRGDPVKDIHWKTSAHSGELVVREREAEIERRLRLVLNLEGRRPDVLDQAREELIKRAASMAQAALDDGWQVRVEAGGKGVDFGAGQSHLLQVLTFLALFDDLEQPEGEALPHTDAPAFVMSPEKTGEESPP